jgi:hypothetical protein
MMENVQKYLLQIPVSMATSSNIPSLKNKKKITTTGRLIT